MSKKSLVLGITFFTCAYAELFTEYFENGIVKSKIEYQDGTRTDTKEGLKHGMETIYHENGKIAYTVNNIEGKRDGRLDWYDPQGHHMEVMYYQMGNRNGINKHFYSNGIVKSEVTYIDDKKEGIEKLYYSTGTLAQETHYKNDKKEGEEKEYYEDGALQSIVIYKNNYKEGEQKWFDHQGKVTRTELYKMDRPVNLMKKVQSPQSVEVINEFKALDFNPKTRMPE